jgi:uncharacterized membrane protein YgcG
LPGHNSAAVAEKAENSRSKTSRRGRIGRQLLSGIMCVALLVSSLPLPVRAQDTTAAASTEDQNYSFEQLDALLAPIALYPDQLLTQILMASAYSDQIKEANDWVQDPAHKALTGSALDQALTAEDWDPSVKSLVPFPQVLGMMGDNLDWTQQLGYAMSVQQSDVMASVQRLRQQAQIAGQLQSTPQQTVSTQGSTIIIAPAQPNVVYVPSYNPTVVYGTWPYPSYPPVYYPPPGYVAGSALVAGLAFGAGVAISASLWGWATPNWGHGNVNVNVNRYNNINVNRPPIHNNNWQANRPGGGGGRHPPAGPVGNPSRQRGMPANSIGRPNVSVPGNIARPPAGIGPGNRPSMPKTPSGPGGSKPSLGQGGNKPAFGQGGGKPPTGQGGNKPAFGQGTRPSTRPAAGNHGGSPGAFNGMGDGRSASQFGNRGAQSQRSSQNFNRGGGFGGGGGARGGGGGHAGGRRR